MVLEMNNALVELTGPLTYYISVAKGEKFKPRFFGVLFISISVALISFVV